MASTTQGKHVTDSALQILKTLPRVSLSNTTALDGPQIKKSRRGHGHTRGKKSGRGHKGQGQHGGVPRIGFEGGQTPFYMIIPKHPYYRGHQYRRGYPPLTLGRLQYLIDLGRIDPTEPIDAQTLTNCKGVDLNPSRREFGVHLTAEGAETFKAKVNIEVQRVSESVISAVERNGGLISSSFYDLESLTILSKPLAFFRRGVPIPSRKLPPDDLIDLYTDPEQRGYLADLENILEARRALAEKHGYKFADLDNELYEKMMTRRKDRRQIFFGLQPGWIVNMQDRVVLKPRDEELLRYYSRK